MRKMMLEDYVNKNLIIDNNAIINLYNKAQFEYETNFIMLKTTEIDKVSLENSFEKISKKTNLKPDSKYITFFNCSNDKICDYFYNKNEIHKGDLIGPIELSQNQI